jgi:predicted RNase H-like nuclease (RuvC/YqgF family)
LPGLIYYWLKDVAPTLGILNDILITPKFLIDFIEEKVYNKKKQINHNNENNNNHRNNQNNNNINNLNNNNVDFNDPKIQLYTLESENNNLKEELMKKEEELNFWKSIRENLNKNITHSINRNDYYSTMKIQQLEKILFNYGKKINDLKNLYNRTLIEQRREKEELKRNYENSLTQMQNLNLNNNLNLSNQIINIENTNNSLIGNKSPSVNLSPQEIPTSPSNNVNLNNILNTIPSATENTVSNSNYNYLNNEEAIRNQFIKDKLESIKKNNPDV